MSNFKTKLLGLAGTAMLFAGMSYGQVSCTTIIAPNVVAGPYEFTNVSPLELRAESETELTSDLVVQCGGSNVVAAGQVQLFTSLPITSKTIPNIAPANSEVVLSLWNVICNPQALAGPTLCPAVTTTALGTVSGSIVSFTGIGFPANFTVEVSNVRVNASAAGATTTPVPVTDSIFIGTNGVASVAFSNVTTGYVLKSLSPPALVLNALQLPSVVNYTVCQGNPVSSFTSVFGAAPSASTVNANLTSFTLIAQESFGGAFKVQPAVAPAGGLQAPGGLANQESGSYVGGVNGVPAAVGTAASGTEIAVTLANVPASATVYVPIQIVNGTLTLTLTGSPTAITAPAPLVASINGLAAIYPLGVTTATPTNNTVALTYQVTASSAAATESANIPIAVTFAANSAATQGPITILEAYGPSAALTGQATSVPTFAVPTNTPLNGSSVTLCQTTLLFPYVTNTTGFETGIAVTNATTDNLGTGGKSVATPTPGAFTLNFYGNQAQPTATVTPTIGAWSATGTQNPIYANTLSAMTGATNFTGYAIAVCPFLDGHGFAFLVDSSGTFSGNMGYLAVVVPNNRSEAAPAGSTAQ